MPRANRYLLPGYACHLTQRCHNREFLFQFGRDRTEYRTRLRASLKEFGISLLNYTITSNHTHLLVTARSAEAISALMQKLEGEFAEYYNIRKRRSGAFWEGRYHGTVVDSGSYLFNCLKYIDLNMVRAGKVGHPREWQWNGYDELVGQRKRYRLLDMDEVTAWCGGGSVTDFQKNYAQVIDNAVERRQLFREPWWTECIAVGSETFVKRVEAETSRRIDLAVEQSSAGQWTVREAGIPYS